ncbi:maleylpyruvate isomerase [Catenulispora sp. GAS73]|uniref:maleylpyruvate isomerase family mycothiol-dependent enzyme n=1 Tax=Catenulispora sp. GAS73 TaxID=3156269 RepID=UPI00351426F6
MKLIEEIRDSGVRIAASLSGIGDAEGREPSALPGWTRAHVVGHLMQSADAYLWMTKLARDGVEPGPRADRAAMVRELEGLAARPIGELAGELAGGLDRLLDAAESMPRDRWDTLVTALAGWKHPVWYTLRRCVRELETHHVDLAVGYRVEDWPPAYVAWALDDTLGTLAVRGFPIGRVEAVDLGESWEVAGEGPVVTGAGHLVLGWLSGRCDAAGLSGGELPEPPAWPLAPLPGWG